MPNWPFCSSKQLQNATIATWISILIQNLVKFSWHQPKLWMIMMNLFQDWEGTYLGCCLDLDLKQDWYTVHLSIVEYMHSWIYWCLVYEYRSLHGCILKMNSWLQLECKLQIYEMEKFQWALWYRPGLSNLRPTGRMRPARENCVTREVICILKVLAELMK